MYQLLEQFKNFASKEKIIDKTFVVGGTVRDLLLKKDLKDADIVVEKDSFKIARSFADSIKASFIVMDGYMGIYRVAQNEYYIDICRMRDKDIYSDLADRDFTINAMAVNLNDFEKFSNTLSPLNLLDPFNGLDDLTNKTIRTLKEQNLQEDPLRLLRAYRFQSCLGFEIEINTLTAIKNLSYLIKNVALERITDEFKQILLFNHSSKIIKQLYEIGMFNHIFPYIKDLSTELINSLLKSFDYVEHIINNLYLYFPQEANPASSYLENPYRLISLKFALLLRYSNSIKPIAICIKLSRNESLLVQKIILNPIHTCINNPEDKTAIVSLLNKYRDDIYSILIFAIAQNCTCQLLDNPILSFCKKVLSFYNSEFIHKLKQLPILTGTDLIKEFHLQPSPLFKKILGQIELMFLEGKIISKKDALIKAENLIKSQIPIL